MSVPADVDRQVDDRLKSLARNVKMPGFARESAAQMVVQQWVADTLEVLGDAFKKPPGDQGGISVAAIPDREGRRDAPASSSAPPSRCIPE
jgi:hypothetical protein